MERTLRCLPWERRDIDHEQHMVRLQALYTMHVISDECCELFNGALRPLTHVVASGRSPDSERPRVVRRIVAFIVKGLFVVDEKPVVRRMFAFRDGIDHALTIHLLGVPANCFNTGNVASRQKTQKRLNYVLRFNHPDASQLLRRTCLALQILGGVTALVFHQDARNGSERASSGGGGMPGPPAFEERPFAMPARRRRRRAACH